MDYWIIYTGYSHSPTAFCIAHIHSCFLLCRDGRLSEGDELLMVNGKSVVGLTRQQVVDILKAASMVQLLVSRKVHTQATGHTLDCNFGLDLFV